MLNYDNKTLCTACFAELPAGTSICPNCGYNEDSSQNRFPIALPLGAVLMGKYVIGNVLGKGGFGITYLAYNLRDNKTVAIKEYLPDALIHRNSGDTHVTTYEGEKADNFNLGAEKFYEEAKTVSKFNGHPNVINVYEFFYENNTAYFVMEYVRGVDLKKYVKQHGGRLTEAATIKLLLPILDALIVVHSVGVLHRDISPDNIFVCDDGNVKLLDFGSARQVLGQQSRSLSVILKPGFAPVEQYQTKGKQGPWTDIYSLAATIYYCITGSVPEDCMNRVSADTLVPPSAMGIEISGLFESILLKAMAFQAGDRYQSVFQLKSDIERISIQAAAVQSVIGQAEPIAELKNTYQSGAVSKKPALNTKLKVIIGVMALCIVILAGIAMAALLNNHNSLQTGGNSGGSDFAAATVSATAAPEMASQGNTTLPSGAAAEAITITAGPTKVPATTAAPTITARPEATTAPTAKPTPTTKPKGTTALKPTAKPTKTPKPTTTPEPQKEFITIKGEKYSTSLTELDLSDQGLTNKDIEPLKYMVNLTKLTLGDYKYDVDDDESNQFTDITPLKSLTKLTALDLWGNNIEDISPLKSLTNLTELDLGWNQITDIKPLKSLTNLTNLDLNSNGLSDITPLKSLTKLTTLNLYNNDITDITTLKSLTKLTLLILWSNNISDADIDELEDTLPDCDIQ